MRNLLLALLFLSSVPSIGQQTYGNEWIDYSQKYYAFDVYKTGITRINYSALVASGVPVSSFTSSNIQVFGREQEIPIFVEDGGDDLLNPGDYILFYAEKNDGWLDSMLYASANDIGNPKYSLYNDTIHYFFTWNTANNNKRFAPETSTDFSIYAPSNFVLSEVYQSFNSAYIEGEKTSEASSSFYTSGEGWGSNPVNGAAGFTWQDWSGTTLTQLYQGQDAPFVRYKSVIAGTSNANYSGAGNHHTRHTIGTSNFVLADSIFIGYKALHLSKEFAPSLLPASGATNFKINIVSIPNVATDFQAVNYWSFTYPRQPNFGGLSSFEFSARNGILQDKVRIDLSNVAITQPVVFVLGSAPKRINPVQNGNLQTLLFSNTTDGSDQKVVYQQFNDLDSITQLRAVNGTGTFTQFSSPSFNVEEALLMIYHPSLASASQEYATYRSTDPNGGNYNVILANVNELYQQYGGGIPKHINGIRRFAHHIYDLASNKPVGLFLMGKGIREANVFSITSIGPGTRKNEFNYSKSLIPSFGQPSSDQLITSNLPGTSKWVPLIPTGRVSVQNNAELSDYLYKIRQFDLQQKQTSIYNSETKDWQKQVLHFVGGLDAGQQFTFQSYMNSLKDTIESAYFGGNVQTLAKSTNAPLDPGLLNDLVQRIQDGVSLITFFGHAAPTTTGFEINIDEPSNWNNTGKYPLVITNSCYNGNIYQNASSKSENFVKAEESGAIAYIGSISLGFPNILYLFTNQLYRQMSSINYGKCIAEQIKGAISAIEAPNAVLTVETTCTQMALNGDPMLKINWHEKPEIELRPEQVTFSPDDINLSTDSITIHVELKNLGKSITDTFSLEITRNFPGSNQDSVYILPIPGLDYTTSVSLTMPLQANIGVGINTFTVKADIPTFVDENYDELNNNQVNKTLFINIDGILPVIPYEFAVVPDDSVTVFASTINPVADFNTYRFEIDTTDKFNSPEHRFAIVSGLGGVKSVAPSNWLGASSGTASPLICEDSTVYFWRVAVNDANPAWRESSFQYIQGKSGWGQDHFFQFKSNGFSGVEYNVNDRTRDFAPFSRNLVCNVIYTTSEPAIYENLFEIDGQLMEYGILNYTPKFHVAVMDRYTLQPWQTRFLPTNSFPNNNFGNSNDNFYKSWKFFTFNQNSATQLAAMQNMIEDTVPDGSYILIYSPMTTQYNQIQSLAPSLFDMFDALGSDSIHPLRPNLPMAFLCKKGDTNSVVELFAQMAGENVHLEAEMFSVADEGQEKSPLIGPAGNWKNVYWKQDPIGTLNGDTTVLSIKAFNGSGSYQWQIDTAFTSNDSIFNLNNLVDALQFPYIQLQATYKDTSGQTPAQIDRWHVLYDALPEAAIDGTSNYTWLPNDTLTEGQDVSFAVDVKNIFTIPMDSLLIYYWVEDANQVKHPIAYARQAPLLVGATFRDTIVFSTIGLSGLNTFWMEVNPYVNGSLYETDQPEQAHFNNLLQLPFSVNNDDVHPILDVTFNGRHILNNDLVSPQSEIVISLKDNNPFLLMNDISDTTLFGVYITSPDGVQQRIPFVDGQGNTVMQWIPAEAQNKRFKIIYPALFEEDGTYQLSVQGSDRSGNLSGDNAYKINFEIEHESSITYLMNYPNPFSTSTRFVFTLTGSEVPDELLIQILTVSGRVVREITEDQLGPIYIGRNISEYAWDGTDEFGDPLANGVYLYRVKAIINGEEIKHRNSGADQHFEKSFGKMYLMR
jgi:hypothetical protein